jgi:phenylalanyl-tRNA synthetase beta chain
VGDQLLGVVGELHPRLVAAWDLPEGRIGAFDLDMAVIEALGQVEPRHAPPSRYPATIQDLAVVVPDAVPAARVEGLIRETGGKLLVGVTLFDVYTGPPVPPGHRSLAYSLAFQALDRTLSEEDVTKLRTRLINRLQREVGATLRA